MLSKLSLKQISVQTEITSADYLSASAMPPLNAIYRVFLGLAGHSYGWHPSHYVARPDSIDEVKHAKSRVRSPDEILFTGSKFGFFHCITATKRDVSNKAAQVPLESD